MMRSFIAKVTLEPLSSSLDTAYTLVETSAVFAGGIAARFRATDGETQGMFLSVLLYDYTICKLFYYLNLY